MKTILIHDAKLSVFPDYTREVECAGIFPFEDGSYRLYEPASYKETVQSKKVRFRDYYRKTREGVFKVRLACDPEIQELLGLELEVFENMENEIEDLRLQNCTLNEKLYELKKQKRILENQSVLDLLKKKLDNWISR